MKRSDDAWRRVARAIGYHGYGDPCASVEDAVAAAEIMREMLGRLEKTLAKYEELAAAYVIEGDESPLETLTRTLAGCEKRLAEDGPIADAARAWVDACDSDSAKRCNAATDRLYELARRKNT